MYNVNKHFIIQEDVCFYYMRRRIMKCLFLLYKTMYNNNKHFIIQEDV